MFTKSVIGQCKILYQMCQITQALRLYPVFKIIRNHINCLMKTFAETNFSVKCVGSPGVAFFDRVDDCVLSVAFCPRSG